MKTLTIKVPDELARRLEQRAKRSGRSKSSLARESIERDLDRDSLLEEPPSVYDLVKDDLGCVDSGVTDLSTNPKHIEGFGR